MNKILNIYKPIGMTPYQLIQKLRIEREELAQIKIGFAGRLDPLAQGVMLLMIGDATKNRKDYLNLDKEYEFEVTFGVSTDTYDQLGFLKNKLVKKLPDNLEEKIEKFVNSKTGKQMQQYPPFSSIEIKGKPLFQWSRENRLSEIQIPSRTIEIYNFELDNVKIIPPSEIQKTLITNVASVDGDFRQMETLEKWSLFFESNKIEYLSVATFNINCSSGTYVRSLANELGEILGCGAIALSILRTRVGKYSLRDSMRL